MGKINDDDIILMDTDFDQSVPADSEWAIQKVRDTIHEAIEKADVTIIESLCIQLLQINTISGKALVELLYLWEKSWFLFGINENFIDYVYVRIGKHRYTVERYLKVGKLLNEGYIPEDFRESIASKSLNELIPIANAVAQGYEIDSERWKRLKNAADAAEVRQIVNKEVKDTEGRRAGFVLSMTREGNIYAYVVGEERRHVGYLENDSRDPVVQAAVQRIVNNSGVIKQ